VDVGIYEAPGVLCDDRNDRRRSAVCFNWRYRARSAIVADRRIALDIEYVWITESSRAIVLDFRCPGLPSAVSTEVGPLSRPVASEAYAFVRRVATVALGDKRSLPLHAHAFLEQLEQRRFPDLKAIAAALQETLGRRAVLTRGRRGVHLALCALAPTCAL
jgi:hypothetical protein